MDYGLLNGSGVQQGHRAPAKPPAGHPAAKHPLHLHGCCHQFIQLFAANLVQVSVEERPVAVSPSAPVSDNAQSNGKRTSGSCGSPPLACQILCMLPVSVHRLLEWSSLSLQAHDELFGKSHHPVCLYSLRNMKHEQNLKTFFFFYAKYK